MCSGFDYKKKTLFFSSNGLNEANKKLDRGGKI